MRIHIIIWYIGRSGRSRVRIQDEPFFPRRSCLPVSFTRQNDRIASEMFVSFSRKIASNVFELDAAASSRRLFRVLRACAAAVIFYVNSPRDEIFFELASSRVPARDPRTVSCEMGHALRSRLPCTCATTYRHILCSRSCDVLAARLCARRVSYILGTYMYIVYTYYNVHVPI